MFLCLELGCFLVHLGSRLLSPVLRLHGYCDLRRPGMFAAAQTPGCLSDKQKRDRKEEIKTLLRWAREASVSVPGIGMIPRTPRELKNK